MTITSERNTVPSADKKRDKPRKSSSLPANTVEYLKAWMMSPEHVAHPYPTEKEKAQIMADTGIELKQLTNWFVNNRKRYWKPRVEARLHQQAHAQSAATAAAVAAVAANQRCNDMNSTFENSIFAPRLQNDAAFTALNLTQQLQRAPQVITASPSSTTNFSNDQCQAPSTIHVVGSPLNQHLVQHFRNQEQSNSNQEVIRNQTFSSPSHMTTENSVEKQCPQVISTGSASSFASDSESLSNDDHYFVPITPSTQQKNCVSFVNESTPGSNSLSLPPVSSQTDCNSKPHIIENTLISVTDQTEEQTSSSIRSVSNDMSVVSREEKESDESSAQEEEPSPVPSEVPRMKRVRSKSDLQIRYNFEAVANKRPRSSTFATSRLSAVNDAVNPSLSKKIRSFANFGDYAPEQWQNACQQAKHVYDDSLPSMEEAAFLFGFGKTTA